MSGVRRQRVEIAGQVQGVGFRPFVYRLASSEGLSGFVGNDAGGVFIEVQGPSESLQRFLLRLRTELPPLARIDSLSTADLQTRRGEAGFVIVPSAGGEMSDAQVTVDTVVCRDCLRELFDPADRRHRYPFINCTNCGPRYSIVTGVPYDRPNTTMAAFEMCPACRREYQDPRDRRFHAQPIACPVCGPRVWLTDRRGAAIRCDDPIAAAADLLDRRRIVAIKGLGGFQLAVAADDDHAVRRLRLRKARQTKPFALMVRDLDAARVLVEVSDLAATALKSPQGPIVLLPARPDAPVAPSVAPLTSMLGLMLPTTPVHHLLLARRPGALVMTSGNVADEPLVKDNDDAVAHLGRIADAILMHDRPIERRVDDSVVMPDARGGVVPVRRARGLAPAPLPVPNMPPAPVLAMGAELKNTFCLWRDGKALVSEHIGDLKDGRTLRHYISTIAHLRRLYGFGPRAVACDLHPAYLSTEQAKRLAAAEALPVIRVQHHHAHVASVLAEHGRTEAVIGIAADGAGYGHDGAVWGCEIFRADLRGYVRLGHLRYFGLPGGDAAAVETYRPAAALLLDALGNNADLGLLTPLADRRRLSAVRQMLSGPGACTPTSSLGRLFDACAALCGIAPANRYEGQAPIALEAAADKRQHGVYEVVLEQTAKDGSFVVDHRPMIRQLADDRMRGMPPACIAAKAPNTSADFLAAAARRARELTGLGAVALSGGCFANRLMSARLIRRLEDDGFEVLTHRLLPTNDAAVCVGQAAVAAAGLAQAAGEAATQRKRR